MTHFCSERPASSPLTSTQRRPLSVSPPSPATARLDGLAEEKRCYAATCDPRRSPDNTSCNPRIEVLLRRESVAERLQRHSFFLVLLFCAALVGLGTLTTWGLHALIEMLSL